MERLVALASSEDTGISRQGAKRFWQSDSKVFITPVELLNQLTRTRIISANNGIQSVLQMANVR